MEDGSDVEASLNVPDGKDVHFTGAVLDQFFLRSSRIRVDLPSYEIKTTDKRWQYDWRAKKNLDGFVCTPFSEYRVFS